MVHYPGGSRRWVHCGHERMDMLSYAQQQYSGRLWCLNCAQLILPVFHILLLAYWLIIKLH